MQFRTDVLALLMCAGGGGYRLHNVHCIAGGGDIDPTLSRTDVLSALS